MSDEDTKFWIYAGGLPYELTEGDIVCVFSQYGEIFEISLSRDKDTGKSRGFCFIKYEDSRSCEMAVDNFNGISIIGRRIKVSHATNTNAVKSRKPAIVAPQEPESSANSRLLEPINLDGQNSPKPYERYCDRKKRKNRHESSGSEDEILKHSKNNDLSLNLKEKTHHKDLGHNFRHDGSTHETHRRHDSSDKQQRRNSTDRHNQRDSSEGDRLLYSPVKHSRQGSPDRSRHRSSPDRSRHRSSPDRSRHRSSPDRSRHRGSPDRSRHRGSPARDGHRESRHNSDNRHKRQESSSRNDHHRNSERKHRHREPDDKERRRHSDRKHRHSRHHRSSDRKSHN